MSVLELQGVHKSFGATSVLRGVDVVVPSGSLTAVLGPSGCGKTTLLRVVAGFEAPDAGAVCVAGREVASSTHGLPPERRRVGLVPQEGALFGHLDVAGNVGFGLRCARRARRHRVEELLELVGLPGTGERRPSELSGGQQQRVALARALAADPDVLLLDEPFSALDAGLRAGVRAEVRRVLREAGATAVLVTHDQQEALSMADHVAVLWGGQVRQHAEPAQVYARPRDLDVARFVGETVELPGHAHGAVADCALGPLPLPAAVVPGPGIVLLRPGQVRFDERSPVRGVVVARTFHGHDTAVRLRLRDGQLLTCRTCDVPTETDVGVAVNGQACFFPTAQLQTAARDRTLSVNGAGHCRR